MAVYTDTRLTDEPIDQRIDKQVAYGVICPRLRTKPSISFRFYNLFAKCETLFFPKRYPILNQIIMQ